MLGRYTTSPAPTVEDSMRRRACLSAQESDTTGRQKPPNAAAKPSRHILDHMTTDDRGGIVDLRSDTVTHPSPAMLKAMYEAELGDDVFSDDPTVNALDERAAE